MQLKSEGTMDRARFIGEVVELLGKPVTVSAMQYYVAFEYEGHTVTVHNIEIERRYGIVDIAVEDLKEKV
jgi:hypothetical protein